MPSHASKIILSCTVKMNTWFEQNLSNYYAVFADPFVLLINCLMQKSGYPEEKSSDLKSLIRDPWSEIYDLSSFIYDPWSKTQGLRINDQRIYEPRTHDPWIHDPRIHDPRIHDPRIPDPRIPDPRVHCPRIHNPMIRDQWSMFNYQDQDL